MHNTLSVRRTASVLAATAVGALALTACGGGVTDCLAVAFGSARGSIRSERGCIW